VSYRSDRGSSARAFDEQASTNEAALKARQNRIEIDYT
jgi:hypothetical protein